MVRSLLAGLALILLLPSISGAHHWDRWRHSSHRYYVCYDCYYRRPYVYYPYGYYYRSRPYWYSPYGYPPYWYWREYWR